MTAMRYSVFLLLPLLFVCPKSSAIQGKLGLTFYGGGAKDLLFESRLAGTEVEGSFGLPLMQGLESRLRAGMQLETGSSHEVYPNPYSPQQRQRLKDALVRWTPIEAIQIDAGVQDQDRLESPLLLSLQSFPAILERAQVGNGPLKLGFIAEQSLAATDPALGYTREQGAPTFFLERMTLEYSPDDKVKLEGRLSHFLFQGLPESVAYMGRLFGNTVDGLGPRNSHFVYGYQGFELGLSASARLSARIEPRLYSEGVLNTAAPSGSQGAYRLGLESAFQLGRSTRLVPSVEVFHIESDASPAYFNSMFLGHNNRQGGALGARLQLPDNGPELGLQAVKAQVVERSPYQSEFTLFYFFIRSQYGVL